MTFYYTISPFIEIAIIAIMINYILSFFWNTRSMDLILGLLAFLLIFAASSVFNLPVLHKLMLQISSVAVIAVLIIFQPELRNALARLGSSKFFSFATTQQKVFLEMVADSVVKLSKSRCGALFAIERTISLEDYESTGVILDAQLSTELVASIFHPKTALHDGGMILKNERIAAAGCIFPVSQKELSDRSLGLRHRAGFGISEESDAVAIVVSEETGQISIVTEGKIDRGLSEDAFRAKLEELFLAHDQSHQEVDHEELDGEVSGSGPSDRDLVSD